MSSKQTPPRRKSTWTLSREDHEANIKKAQAISLHQQGLLPGTIAKMVHVNYHKVQKWINEHEANNPNQ